MHAATGTCVECLGHILLALKGPTLALRSLLFRLICFSAAALQIAALQEQYGPAKQLLEQHLEHAQMVGGCMAAPQPRQQAPSL